MKNKHGFSTILLNAGKSKTCMLLTNVFKVLYKHHVTAPDTPDCAALDQACLGRGPACVRLTASPSPSGCLHTLMDHCADARYVCAGVGAVTVGFSTSPCLSCQRKLPRAAARCPWCLWLVGRIPTGPTLGAQRSASRGTLSSSATSRKNTEKVAAET